MYIGSEKKANALKIDLVQYPWTKRILQRSKMEKGFFVLLTLPPPPTSDIV